MKKLLVALAIFFGLGFTVHANEVEVHDYQDAVGYTSEVLLSLDKVQWFQNEYGARQWCGKFNRAFENSCSWSLQTQGYRAAVYWDKKFIGSDRYSQRSARSNVLQQILDFLANDNIAAIFQSLIFAFLQ